MDAAALLLFLPLLFSQHLLLHTSAQEPQEEVSVIVDSLPICNDDQFVTFNGSQLLCRTMTLRECNCPVLVPDPPIGCQKFAPPDRGGFVCLQTDDTIYCSVQCDNTGEFDTFPLNPYRCGPETDFLWADFTEKTYKKLPRCDYFRISQPNFLASDYLPVPCNKLTDDQKREKFEQLLLDVQWIYNRCTECDVEQAYVDCPPT